MSSLIKRTENLLVNYRQNEQNQGLSLEKIAERVEQLKKENSGFRVIFAFDTTGSMTDCIQQVRTNLEKIIDELLIQEKGIQIMVAGVAEYDDGYTLQIRPYSDNPEQLKKNMQSIRNGGGGGACQVSLELLFQELNNKYISGNNNALVIVTDQIAHGQDGQEPDPKADYKIELSRLKEHLKGFYFVSCTGYSLHKGSEYGFIVALQKELVSPKSPNEKFIELDDIGVLPELLIALTKGSLSRKKLDDYLLQLRKSDNLLERQAGEKIRGYLAHGNKS